MPGIIAARLEPAPAQDDLRGFATVLDPAGLTDFVNQYRDAEAQVAVAKARLAASQAAYQRAQILNKDQQNVSTAQLQSAQSAFNVDSNSLAAAQTHAAGVIANTRQVWGDVIANGLAGDSPLLSDLIARRSFLVRVTLPPGVVASTPSTVASAAYGSANVRLTLVSLAAAIDPKLQGVSYLYETPAQNPASGAHARRHARNQSRRTGADRAGFGRRLARRQGLGLSPHAADDLHPPRHQSGSRRAA